MQTAKGSMYHGDELLSVVSNTNASCPGIIVNESSCAMREKGITWRVPRPMHTDTLTRTRAVSLLNARVLSVGQKLRHNYVI